MNESNAVRVSISEINIKFVETFDGSFFRLMKFEHRLACSGLKFLGAGIACVVGLGLSFLVESREFGEDFDFFTDSAAFGSPEHAVNSRQIPWKM